MDEGAMTQAESVVGELQVVLEQACGALAAQEEGRTHDAVQGYFLARSRLHYVAHALLQPMAEASPADPNTSLAAAACAMLAVTYTAAIEQLTSGCPGPGGGCRQWAAGNASEASEETEEDWGEEAGQPVGHFQGRQQHPPRRHAGDGLLEARRQPCRVGGGGAAGAGGAGQHEQPGGSTKEQRALVAAGRRCLQEVQGSLEEVVGLEAIKQEMREAVLLPMRFPHLFTGIRRPQCNIMLFGLPGTGKTMLVEKLAAEAGVPLLAVSPSAILSKWAGESEKTLKGVFEAAAALAPALVFVDEADSLAPARSSGDDLAARRVLTELLVQMSAATNRTGSPVYVLAASNRPQDCDPALLRRFDRKIEVPPPGTEARAAFFAATVTRPEIDSHLSEAELCELAAATEGCTGSHLAAICREAALAPVRELLAGLADGGTSSSSWADVMQAGAAAPPPPRPVACADFLAAISKMVPAVGSSSEVAS